MKNIFLLIIPFLLISCNENHPETFLGIKLGYSAEEQLEKAAKENPEIFTYGNIHYLGSEIILSEEDGIKGKIYYTTFKNDPTEDDLLESLQIEFYKETGYLSSNDLLFIKKLYFDKYGYINEENKSEDYINNNQDSNYQEIINTENVTTYSYQWNKGNLRVILDIRATGAKVNYYYITNFIRDQKKSEIEEKLKNNF